MSAKVSAAQQVKIYNAALFAQTTRQHSLINMLTNRAPQGTSEIGKKQTDAGAPIVRVTDLEKEAGNEVSMDIVHDINKAPTMGDDRLAGRGDSMTFATTTLKIDQSRHMLESGGKMLRKGTKIQLPAVAVKMLQGYYKNLEEERMLIHAAGARGTRLTTKMIIPTEDDPNFDRYMINKVKAPTASRQFFGGDATSIETLDGADLFSLNVVDDIWLALSEMDNPLQHLRLEGDEMADDSAMHVMFVTPRQWNDFYTSTTNKDWQQMQAQAMNRGKGFNHALFRGDCLMYRSILIRPMNRFIEFEAGSQVNVAADDMHATESKQTAGVRTHRAVMMGAQALGQAWGNAVKKGSKSQFSATTEDVDHGNSQEHSIAWMNGTDKLRFADRDGKVHDHGIVVADTAVSA